MEVFSCESGKYRLVKVYFKVQSVC